MDLVDPPDDSSANLFLRASVRLYLALWANRGPYFENGGRPLGPAPTTATVKVAPGRRGCSLRRVNFSDNPVYQDLGQMMAVTLKVQYSSAERDAAIS